MGKTSPGKSSIPSIAALSELQVALQWPRPICPATYSDLRPDLPSPEAEAVAETTARLVKRRNLEQAARHGVVGSPARVQGVLLNISESPHSALLARSHQLPWRMAALRQNLPFVHDGLALHRRSD